VLVVQRRNLADQPISPARTGPGDMAVPAVSRVERHVPTIVLVVREHADAAVEAACVSR